MCQFPLLSSDKDERSYSIHDAQDTHWITEDNRMLQDFHGQDGITVKGHKDLTLTSAVFSLSSLLYQHWYFINLFALSVFHMTFNYWITSKR